MSTSRRPADPLRRTAPAFALALAAASPASAAMVDLRLMETTDLHMYLLPFDYYADAEIDDVGLARTATLVREARAEVDNSMLFDNGDLIQGNPLGDWVARSRGLSFGEVHPAFAAMNLLGYDAANVGNHEFNYGLEFLLKTLAGADFPYVLANVYAADADDDPANDVPYFRPYALLERTLVDRDGAEHDVTVGVVGFTPPQIMVWDKSHLEGRVTVRGIVETAEEVVPEMREAGADLVVAVPHSGLSVADVDGFRENASAQLARVDGIDAILFGHSHSVFPSESYEGFPGADLAKGTLHGVPSVMPGFWGSHLGLVDLVLDVDEAGEWSVIDGGASVRAIAERDGRDVTALVESQQDVVDAVSAAHEGARAWMGEAVGTTTAPIDSFFALVRDDPSIQIVTDAQAWYAEKVLQGTEYDGLPILSAGAPFKAGGRGGPDNYTNLAAGDIAIRNVADLYIYPNTLRVVKLTGAQVREWLERSAGQFDTVDPASSEPQALVNENFPSYNFDVIDGVTYRIDVTEPSRYDGDGELANPDAHRIVDLAFDGAPIDPDAEFAVVTNNYRAGGGGDFPGLDGSTIIVEAPQTNRQVLVDYILDNGRIDPAADGNWGFAPIDGDVTLTFETSPAAAEVAGDDVEPLGTLDSGFARYRLVTD